VIIQVYSHPHTQNPHELTGEIVISGGVVVDVFPDTKKEHWTNVQVGMTLKQAIRFIRNHSGYGTYVRIEYPPGDETEQQTSDLKKSEKETPAGGPVYDLGHGYELRYHKGYNVNEYDQDRWKDAWIIKKTGSDEIAGSVDITHAPEKFGTFVAESKVHPEHRGKGLGRISYRLLANHYGSLSSDELWSSDDAMRAWQSLKATTLNTKNSLGQQRQSLTGDHSPVVWESDLKKADMAPPLPPPSHYEAKAQKQQNQHMKELSAISHIESSGGKFRNHEIQTSGLHNGTFAHSSYGLMPVSVKELADKDAKFSSTFLGKKISTLDPIEDMHEIHKITGDPNKDTEIASHMWSYVKSRVEKFSHKDHVSDVAAYAWRKGITASKKMYKEGGIDAIRQHGYVKKFNELAGKKQPVTYTPTVGPVSSDAIDMFNKTLTRPDMNRQSVLNLHKILGQKNSMEIIPEDVKKYVSEYLGHLGFPKSGHDEETVPHIFEIMNNPVTRKTFMSIHRDKFPTDESKEKFMNVLSNTWKNLNIGGLKKSRGRLEFPNAIPTRQDQQVAPISTQRQARIFAIRSEAEDFPRDANEAEIVDNINKHKLSNIIRTLHEKSGIKLGKSPSYDTGVTFGGGSEPPLAYALNDAEEYHKEHEAIHMALYNIGHKYGAESQAKVTNSLNKMIHPHVKKMIHHLVLRLGYRPDDAVNEYVPYLHGILHNSGRRSQFKKANGLSDLALNHYMGHAKKSWNAIREFGKNYKPEEQE
jgi:hypothetical protein